MKKFLILLGLFTFTNLSIFAQSAIMEGLRDGDKAVYSPLLDSWSKEYRADYEIPLTKKFLGGSGSYSQYYFSDGVRAITLNSDFEFIKDGNLIAVDNANLKYSRVIYSAGNVVEIPITYLELQQAFPYAELIRLSQWQGDNKIWVKKGFFEKKYILIINDTDKYYYNLTAKSKCAQNKDIRGLIKLSRFGVYNFTHYGERDGKLKIYVKK